VRDQAGPHPGLFFTGTDTGVGKTMVTAAVALELRRRGHAVAVRKPIATGARARGSRWVSDDTVRLAEAAGVGENWEEITPWAFPDPVAPPVAARRHGVRPALAAVVEAVFRQRRRGEVLLVEGVGGLFCPLTDEATVADLAAAVGLPVVVVARRALGTLNHTLLTLEAARSRRLVVAGVVVNDTAPPARGLAEETNVAELRRLAVPVLAVVPYRGPSPPGDVPELGEVDWWQLSCSPAGKLRPGARTP
jgi:dethiobiotin synthetase